MKLTEKCKEDFLKYLNELPVAPYEVMLDNIPQCYLNALIIEFLDSVGIYIGVLICIDETFDSYILQNDVRTECSQFQEFRIEAINEAIVKANKLYNGK